MSRACLAGGRWWGGPGRRVGIGIAFAASVLVGSMVATACGGSGAKHPTPTAVVDTPTAVPATPDPGIEVNGSTYRLLKKGYAITVPQGWSISPNYFNDVALARFPTDALFPVGASGDATASVTIECLKASADEATTEAFRDARAALAAQIGKSVSAPNPVNVGTEKAYEIDYVQEIPRANTTLSLEKSDVVAVVGDCRWLVSLSTPADQRAARRADFAVMLTSMSFFPPQQ